MFKKKYCASNTDIATLSICHSDWFAPIVAVTRLPKQPLTALRIYSPYRVPHISVEALAADVNIFANKAAMWIVQTGRADQASNLMRLHQMWPAQARFICHACVLSQERHRIITPINRCWWFVGLVLNKHGNDPLTSYTKTTSSRGFISHLRLWSGHVVIFHFCLLGTLLCVCRCTVYSCLQWSCWREHK